MEPTSFTGVTSAERKNKKSLHDICRLCSVECQSKFKNVFQKRVLEMLDFSFSFCPSQDDELPKRVCESCFESLTRSYQFKMQIVATDSLLREKLKDLVLEQNILDIALDEAEIKDEQTGISQMNIDVLEEKIPSIKAYEYTESNESDLDSKCSVTIHQIGDINQNPSHLKEDSKARIMKTRDDLKNICIPPLVPIQHTENSKRILRNQDLSQEPPPLVPLKPVFDESSFSKFDKEPSTKEIECEKNSPLHKIPKDNIETYMPSKSLFCNICRKEFNNGKKLIGHLKGHMVSKNFSCKICGKKYPNPSTFQIHMRSHTGERPFKCPVCDKGFTRWAGVVSHMQTHEDSRPFKCEYCDQSFKILSNLERHKVLHSDVLPFCCNYCGKTFSQSSNLQLHIRTYHTNEKPFLCSQCGKSFVSSTRLNRHMSVHTGYKPFLCKICSKGYSNSGDLRYHERSAHGAGESEKAYACKLCDKRFLYSCRLSKHLKTHQRPYSCAQCNKSFTSGDTFERHTKRRHPDVDSTNVPESKVIIVIE